MITALSQTMHRCPLVLALGVNKIMTTLASKARVRQWMLTLRTGRNRGHCLKSAPLRNLSTALPAEVLRGTRVGRIRWWTPLV